MFWLIAKIHQRLLLSTNSSLKEKIENLTADLYELQKKITQKDLTISRFISKFNQKESDDSRVLLSIKKFRQSDKKNPETELSLSENNS